MAGPSLLREEPCPTNQPWVRGGCVNLDVALSQEWGCLRHDDHKGLRAALAARLTGAPWHRCQFHLQQNAAKYVPRVEMRKAVANDIRSIFNARNQDTAAEILREIVTKYRETAPKLSEWMEVAIAEGLTVFDPRLGLSETARKRLRTTNGLERVNKELKRRTRVATLFPNEESLLRLV